MSTATAARTPCAPIQSDELIVSHLWLVRHIINRLMAHLPPNVDAENLESAGMLGLVSAAKRFDASRGNQFKTYAYTCIRGAILDELRRNCPLPQRVLQQAAKVRKAHAQLSASATVEGLAKASGLTTEEVSECLSALRLTRMASLDSCVQPAVIPMHQRRDQPESRLEEEEDKQLLDEAVASLPQRQRSVVTWYYMENRRLKDIGQVLDLSESRVSRLLSEAIDQLRDYYQGRAA